MKTEIKGLSYFNINDSSCFHFDHPGSFYGDGARVYFDGVLSMVVQKCDETNVLKDGTDWDPISRYGKLMITGPFNKTFLSCMVEYM